MDEVHSQQETRTASRAGGRAGWLLQFPLCESRACVQMTYCFAALVGLRRTHTTQKRQLSYVVGWITLDTHTHGSS